MVTITDTLAADLVEKIRSMMHYYRHDPNGVDFECHFCGRKPATNLDDIQHAPDCNGHRFLGALQPEAHDTVPSIPLAPGVDRTALAHLASMSLPDIRAVKDEILRTIRRTDHTTDEQRSFLRACDHVLETRRPEKG